MDRFRGSKVIGWVDIFHQTCDMKDQYLRVVPVIAQYQWFQSLFRCRIELLNFSMGFNIIAPYMEMLHINRSLHHWYRSWHISPFTLYQFFLQLFVCFQKFILLPMHIHRYFLQYWSHLLIVSWSTSKKRLIKKVVNLTKNLWSDDESFHLPNRVIKFA